MESHIKRERVSDAPEKNWVDRFAPGVLQPYLHLARMDRPIGTWLLLWPCWWSIALATPAGRFPDPGLLALFAAGALLMRGAGCTYNDILDRDIDAKVARTRSRPLPGGRVSPHRAWSFLALQLGIAFLILLQFNSFAVAVGAASLGLVAIYPVMKRITYWPQLFLGLAFNWGALLGWAAVRGELSLPPLLLYIGGIFWTLGYDTIYAHQDIEDDARIGVKSTARLFGARTQAWLTGFYVLAMLFFLWAGIASGAGPFYILGTLLAGIHLLWQVGEFRPGDTGGSLRLFRSNTGVGWFIFLGLLAAPLFNLLTQM